MTRSTPLDAVAAYAVEIVDPPDVQAALRVLALMSDTDHVKDLQRQMTCDNQGNPIRDTPDQAQAYRRWFDAVAAEREILSLGEALSKADIARTTAPESLFEVSGPEGIYQVTPDRRGVWGSYEVHTSTIAPIDIDTFKPIHRVPGTFLFRFTADPGNEAEKYKNAVQCIKSTLKAPSGLSLEDAWAWKRARIHMIVEENARREVLPL